MLIVETIARIRREHFIKGKTIKEIARDLKVSRSGKPDIKPVGGMKSSEGEFLIGNRPSVFRCVMKARSAAQAHVEL